MTQHTPGPVLSRSQTVSSVSGQPESVPLFVPDRPLPAVVINPSHVTDLATLRTQITSVCAELGWAPPLWLPTTIEDPGGAQAKTALAAGAEVVLSCGGTIRHVAHVLAKTGTPLGLLPIGTANLLARNLAMTLNDPAHATRIALSGTNRAIRGRLGTAPRNRCSSSWPEWASTRRSWLARLMSRRPNWALAYFVVDSKVAR